MSEQWSDKVQLRLRMTSEQINEQRERDASDGQHMGVNRARVVRRLFDHECQHPWKGTVRSKPTVSRGVVHYNYHAALLRDVANGKSDKGIRRYWNRQAAKLEEKALEHGG